MQTQVNTLLQLPFHHLKVADLREILKTLGLRKSGNKENLIENLKLYLRKLGQSSDINSLTEVAGLLDRYLPKKSSNNNRYKILLYCSTQTSAENSIRKGTDCPIQYPCQPVLKINEVEVTGMEHNKSWSTKPVDITPYCKKKGIQNNTINEIKFRSMFISSRWDEFVVKIIICEYLSLQEAVNVIKKHFISKEELLRQSNN
ncbi:hypothetical protein H8356DRAFT_931630 [Neocallimastix lanati (nom. inval.)]|uniref:SAP domain-containing protein n=1 Tax=Neocallimastix californiae TaxID=1754190 RepID=A0A1Y2F269_9FUNG|nr:hypothetical protein H8356DRAFT_931630 [Neocallimastix sp. JGI-2020a]ORY77961.1 hypothetical protein LY90DRAFT_501285 [Neocallimastix californiae]|eukprot:ORY77961.1 hypothetical protein LY90DRAFT_501285 [Neocallimastix californiae]